MLFFVVQTLLKRDDKLWETEPPYPLHKEIVKIYGTILGNDHTEDGGRGLNILFIRL